MSDVNTLLMPGADWAVWRSATQQLTDLQIGMIAAIVVTIWLSGFLSRAGGRKWRRRFEQERAFYVAYRTRAAAVNRQNRHRIARLEAQLQPTVAAAPDALAPSVEPENPAERPGDLARLRGLNSDLLAKLTELGLRHYEDIETLSAQDEMALEERLGVPVGYVARVQWRAQAALLRAGNDAEFNARFGLIEA